MRAASARLSRTALVAVPILAIELGTAGAACGATPAGIDSSSATPSSDAGAITGSTNETLELAVVVNDHATGEVGEFVIRAGHLFARSDEMRSLGFRVPATVAPPADLVPLEGLPGISTRIDQSTQTLYVSAETQWLEPTLLGPPKAPAKYVIETSTGATLNYDLIGTSTNGDTVASGALDFRAFSGFSLLSSGLLFHTSLPSDPNHHGLQLIRLDTTYVYSDPNSLRRYRLGDFINGGLPWTRPVRMAGAQVNLDFSMRPDLITFPVPEVSGSAAVPSTVDVLVNNRQVVSGAVPPGPFQIPQVPVVNGSGTVTTTVTNALGQQVVTETPFYATPSLLAPSLQTYSGEIGFVRRFWGILSNDYGPLAGSLTYRRGLSDGLTIEAHGEATKGLAMGGLGAVVNLFNFAVANVAIAGSSHSGAQGLQFAAGIERITPFLSFGGSVIVADHRFADVAALNGDPVTRLQLNLHAGLSLPHFGSLGLAYVEIKRSTDPSPALMPQSSLGPGFTTFPVPLAEHSKLVTASYSRQFGRVSFYATAFRDFAAESRSTAILVGITVPIGRRISASVSGQSVSGKLSGQADVHQTAVVPGEWGFRAFVSADQQASSQSPESDHMSAHEFGQVTYKAQWGQVYAGVDRIDGQTTVQGELVGAISLIDHAVFLSNRIDDSFAVVDTGVRGIRVRYENRDAGRTDPNGRLLVPDLLAFEPNQISIEPLDAPIDAEVPVTKRTVRPMDRSGIVIGFPIRIAHSALLRIVDASGKPIAVGSSAVLRSTNVAVPVGYDGEAYIVDLQPHNDVTVEQTSGRVCHVEFDYKPVQGIIPTLGPLLCRDIADDLRTSN